MHRSKLSLAIPLLVLVSAVALPAQEPPRFLFGLENRFGPPPGYDRNEYSWGVIPNFSFFLSERLRLDAFAGMSWTESDDFTLSLQPGLRYYLRPGPGKVRVNSGFSLGFEVLDHTGHSVDRRRLEELGLTAPELRDDDPLWLRLIPVEVEYWSFKRTAFTFSLDYQTELSGGTRQEDDDFGVAVGFRYRIR